MFYRLVELIIALYYGALDESDGKDTRVTKPPAETSADREVSRQY